MFRSIDPTTGVELQRVPTHGASEVAQRLARARAAFDDWSALPLETRAEHLRAVAGRLRAHRTDLAARMTDEMGKPVSQGLAEVDKCAWVCEHYADHAAAYLAPEPVAAKADESVVRYEPLGIVLAIMPWNFPLWQVYRFAAPALMAGNVVLVKHAPSTPGCSADIVAHGLAAGLPGGVLQEVRVEVDAVGSLIADPAVAAVTLTGSDRAGRAVASLAGAHLKKVVLELGGSDPFIVLADADVDAAVATGVASRCLNNGQSCIAAKRFIVEAPVAEAFTRALVSRMAALRVGDPADPGTEVGPLAREDLRDALADQVARSVAAGATVATGGQVVGDAGWYYAPTVLTDVPEDCPAATEELFGPVAPVFVVADEDAAVALANRTRFGLSASLWTRDPDRARRLADRIQAGAVFVNDMSYSDPRLPFGASETRATAGSWAATASANS